MRYTVRRILCFLNALQPVSVCLVEAAEICRGKHHLLAQCIDYLLQFVKRDISYDRGAVDIDLLHPKPVLSCDRSNNLALLTWLLLLASGSRPLASPAWRASRGARRCAPMRWRPEKVNQPSDSRQVRQPHHSVLVTLFSSAA